MYDVVPRALEKMSLFYKYEGPPLPPPIPPVFRTSLLHTETNKSLFIRFIIKVYTDGNKTLHTLLVKHYNDYLDRQSCGRSPWNNI